MGQTTDSGRDARIDAVWATAGRASDEDVLAAVEELAAQRPADDPDALHERASAFDYVGDEAAAEPLYRQALAGGAAALRSGDQLASTLRNLGRAAEAVDLLETEIAADPDDGLQDARAAFLALALDDAGHHERALRVALSALASHLPRYQRAVSHYAEAPASGAEGGEVVWNPMVPELLVADLDRSRRFYVDVVGFGVRFQRADPPFAYLDLGGAQLMLAQDHDDAWCTGALTAPRGRGVNLQIEVPDLTAVQRALAAADVSLYRAPSSTTYDVGDGRTESQRELLVQDPDGYLLRCVEVLEEPAGVVSRSAPPPPVPPRAVLGEGGPRPPS